MQSFLFYVVNHQPMVLIINETDGVTSPKHGDKNLNLINNFKISCAKKIEHVTWPRIFLKTNFKKVVVFRYCSLTPL